MLKLFTKKSHQMVINDELPLVLNPKETVLNGALRNNVKFPYSCKVGGCGSCKCRLVEGKVKELTDKSYLLTKEEIEQNFILGCQSIAKTDLVLDVLLQAANEPHIAGVIERITPLTHDISEVCIRLDAPVTYKAGQYAKVKVVDSEVPARCYSFAHGTNTEDTLTIEFFVRAIPNGRMSNWLVDLSNVGKSVLISNPEGEFYLRDESKPLLCVVGGSGLAPIVSILEDAIRDQHPVVHQPVSLLMGARTQKDLYYAEEILALKKQWQGAFDFLPVLSEEPDNSSWSGARGFVTDFINELNAQYAAGYLCGPPAMIDAAIERMKAQGIKSENIFFDKFSDQSG